MLKLKVLKDGVELQSVDLQQGSKPAFVVGRAPESDIRLNDRAVGREHAVLVVNNKGLILQKRSKFGKLAVNGSETAESQIKAGDVIAIADYLMRIEDDGTAAIKTEPVKEVSKEVVISPNTDFPPPLDDVAIVPEAGTAPLPGLEGLSAMPNATPAQSPNSSVELQAPPMPPEAEAPAAVAIDTAKSETALLPPVENATSAPVEMAGSGSPGGEIGGGFGGDSDRTAMISQVQVVQSLTFAPGAANVQEYVLKKAEISIGRGTNCDVVLLDKKASRKHVLLKRVGMVYVAQDLGSGNGTYVNDELITEKELVSEDVLRIGDTEFTYRAINQDYFEQQANFMAVPPDMSQDASPPMDAYPHPREELTPPPGLAPSNPFAAPTAFDPNRLMINGGIATGAQMGQSPQAKPGKESLMDKFKRQPPIRKLLIVAVIAAMVFYVLDDEEAQKKPAPQPKTAAEKADRSFDALPPEKKQFVLNTYQLALDNYKNGQNEQAIRNVDQILEILPGGYREAIMTKDYAKRAIEIKRANEEERRRKEQEEKTRAEVAELVTKAQTLVEAGKDNEAKAVFAQILEKDPENPTVLRLRQEMEERDQKRKAELDAQQSREAKRKSLEAILKEARALFNAGKYYSCIEKLEDAPAIFAGNPKELAQAKALMARARQTLKEKARPHLDAANNAMIAGDYTTARDAYFRALKVDSRNAEAKKGLAKIKDILHDRAKKIYTEGVIAESLSDFKSATARYRECLNQSMPEDIYYGRCLRKTKRFEMINRDPATPGGSLDRGGMAPGPREGEEADPQMPKLPGDGGSQ